MTHTLNARNDFIMTALSEAVPMLRNMARQYHCDFEDLYQEAGVVCMRAYERAQAAQNMHTYVHAAIKLATLAFVQKYCKPEISLDTPLYDDSDTTYADTLPARDDPSEQEWHHLERRIDATHIALGRLPVEEQMYLVRVYGLVHEPKRPTHGKYARREPDFNRSSKTVSSCALNHLRRDSELAQAVCC
jgi:DNA-directed RNA polymerase specialized sigma24 family protein